MSSPLITTLDGRNSSWSELKHFVWFLNKQPQPYITPSLNQPPPPPLTFHCFLYRHCGVRNPSWSELKHFVWFLNNQLLDFEVSAFCSLAAVEDLPGFAQFVLRFLIQMSRVSHSLLFILYSNANYC